MTTIATVCATGGIVFGAATLQRAVGFGFALLAVPLMAFVVPTKNAVIVVFLNGAITSTWLAVRLAGKVDRRVAGYLAVGTVAGAPLGVLVLRVVAASTLRLVLGAVVCVAAVWIIAASRVGATSAVARPPRTIAVGVTSGVLATSLATNGPPLVYELRRTGFEDDRFRATISAAFLVSNVVGLPLLVTAGLVSASDVTLAVVSIPPCIAGIAVGAWIGSRMETAHFAWAVDLLLLTTGAVTMAKALA